VSRIISNSSSILLSIPSRLEKAKKLINRWGFLYKTCMIWYQDAFEVSDKVELLLVSTKGIPPMIQQSSETEAKTEKPELVRQMISATYTGPKVELTFGDSTLEEWAMWQ